MNSFDIKIGSNFNKILDCYSLELIGRGGFKYVFSVDDKKIGKKVALYTIKKTAKGYNEV